MEAISTIILKIIWGIVGGTISLACICGVIGALGYMGYYLVRYGYKEFEKEFMQ